MQPIESITRPLLEAGADRLALVSVYAQYAELLITSPFWSEACPHGIRINWRQAAAAANHLALKTAFNSAGVYLFGDGRGEPMYLGMTGQTLRQRLNRRYVRGEMSQCQLAVTFREALIAEGIAGFPDSIREWYRNNYGSSTVRLRGAVEVAKRGPEDIWFTLIPTVDKIRARILEAALIPIANEWNKTHGFATLLNIQESGEPEKVAWRVRPGSR